MRKFKTQLIDSITNKAIATAGGVCYVAENGGTKKVALFNADGSTLANPVALVNGMIEFNTADANNTVDLYIQSPTGHFAVLKNVDASGDASVYVDRSRSDTTMVIPFNATDVTANVEIDTGFNLPLGMVSPIAVGVQVTAIDATETINVGTDSTDSGDADGFIVGIALGVLGMIKASLANGAVTLGALLKVQDSANAGDAVPEANTTQGGKSITYTLSAGTDTAQGFILLPVVLPVTSL